MLPTLRTTVLKYHTETDFVVNNNFSSITFEKTSFEVSYASTFILSVYTSLTDVSSSFS